MNEIGIAILICLLIFLIYLVLDIRRVMNIKIQSSLPEEDNISLSPVGVVKLYEYLRDPSCIPSEIVLNEDFFRNELKETCQYINSRYDCADFWCQLLFRMYKDFRDQIPLPTTEMIRDVLVGFKFWMDEPGDDSMCYFSENHTLLFSTLEYLVGNEWKDSIFPNSNWNGREHMEKGRTRLIYWFDQKFKFGFFEWYSNNYFLEDLAPLAQLIEYAPDNSIKELAIAAFNLIMFEVATHSVNNRFCAVSSRMYTENKASNQFGNKIQPIMDALFQDHFEFIPIQRSNSETTINKIVVNLQLCVISMLKRGCYTLPPILKAIANDSTSQVILSSNGLNPEEYKALGLLGQDDYQIISQFSNETFVNPGFSNNTFKYHKKNGMLTNAFSFPFKYIDLGMIRLTHLMPLVCRLLDKNLMPTGITLSRGNVYTYRTKSYLMATAVRCHTDYNGTQHHVFTVNLSNELNVFIQYPSSLNPAGSPGYWIGNRRMPMSVQDESINLTIFRMAKHKRLAEFGSTNFTHVHFPREKFDEVILENTCVFGRIGSVFVAIRSNCHLKYHPFDLESAKVMISHKNYRLSSPIENPLDEHIEKVCYHDLFDLCADQNVHPTKNYHMYITEVSDNKYESFEEFIKRIKINAFKSEGNKLFYQSKNRDYDLEYLGNFMIDKVPQNLEFPRFESVYCSAKRGDENFHIHFGGDQLTLKNSTECDYLKK